MPLKLTFHPSTWNSTQSLASMSIRKKCFGSIEYIIEDLDFKIQTRISKRWLEEPTFNMVYWYLQYLEYGHHYSKRFEAKQQEPYEIQLMFSPNSLESGSASLSLSRIEEWNIASALSF
jgi:hypothetical protein